VTDRQRDLLRIVALLDHCDKEFTVQEIVTASKNQITKSFTSSHVNQMLGALQNVGLVYKNRHGRYSFAVPLLAQFIRRQMEIDRQMTAI
jgi:DNA-binding IclR family transcriptional regulator